MHNSLPIHPIVFGWDSCVQLVMSTHVPLVVIERPAVCPCGLAVKALGTGWSGRAAETSLQTPTTANEKSHQRAKCENSSLRKSCFVVSKIIR